MKFSAETRVMMLSHRLKMLSMHEKENAGLIRKVKRELRKAQNEQQETC